MVKVTLAKSIAFLSTPNLKSRIFSMPSLLIQNINKVISESESMIKSFAFFVF